MLRNTDAAWEHYGRQNPYYGVLTDPRYLADRFDGAARENFFSTGADHVETTLATIRRTVAPEFRPRRAVDFGCGVGRLTVPLAQACDQVVGVDVSASMLDEARANCTRLDVQNARFVTSDDDLSQLPGSYDFLHSYIVLQHIPVARGMQLIKELVGRLDAGGVGALHITYGASLSLKARSMRRARLLFPPAHWVVNILRGRPFRTPMMQMNLYDLGKVIRLVQLDANPTAVHIDLTDHSGFLGAMVYFRKANSQP